MSASEIATLVVSVVSVSVAVAAYFSARHDPRPRIRGSINAVLHAPLALPDGREITAIMLHVTLTNSRQNPTHVVSYDLEIERDVGPARLRRLSRVREFPALQSGDRRIRLTDDVLLYRPPRPVEYGAPLVGVVVFYIEEPDVSEDSITRYRFSVTDIFGQTFDIEDRRGLARPGALDVVELFELAGATVDEGDRMFSSRALPALADAVAPDGSDVRLLLGLKGGGLAHFELGARQISVPVRHRSVDEIWYFVAGRGEMSFRLGDTEEIAPVEPGVCVTIPVGTRFQFRSLGDEPLAAIGVTMPPWPGEGEAVLADGPWVATVSPGPGLGRT
jgi:mannose-6-phosphate isomerase-like protein (cupin superfamily)